MRPAERYKVSLLRGFNPRTRKGCDKNIGVCGVIKNGFNPRTRKGCDQSNNINACDRFRFNPRTRKGCDLPTKAVPSLW